ncbi:MAG TPA: cysteine protease StiP family protein [Jatrophihabitantaceae bacterium]
MTVTAASWRAPSPGSPSARSLPAPLRGPGFGSYRPDEVAWLVTDLSGVALERPVADREPAIVAGTAHYAESLPVEYRPTPAYQQLFRAALAANARRVAADVGVLAEQVRAARPRPVLVSLARAGTPIGILLRRWLHANHGIAAPHYAVSIVRDRGIDLAALGWLAAHHDPADVVFVDGWTGKGVIARELVAAITDANDRLRTAFAAELGVLADPGANTAMFGTRADYLIPSACLNSTVSGLVSRTVLNPEHLAPGGFHGAKYYPELAADDVSAMFLDAITAQFGAVSAEVRARVAARTPAPPTWAGWAAVRALADDRGIADLNLIKPGVGEATRVLLRRRPACVLLRPSAAGELDHLRQLAVERAVPVEDLPPRYADLPYSCVGIVTGPG